MRFVAFDTVASRGLVNRLTIDRLLVVVAREAKCGVGVLNQLDPGDVLVHTHFVTGEAPHRDRCVNVSSL